MAWRRPWDKPLSEPGIVSFPTHISVIQPLTKLELIAVILGFHKKYFWISRKRLIWFMCSNCDKMKKKLKQWQWHSTTIYTRTDIYKEDCQVSNINNAVTHHLPAHKQHQSHFLTWHFVSEIFRVILHILFPDPDHLKRKRHNTINSGVGVTKPISSVPLFPEFFIILKTNGIYWRSRLYLTGVAAAQLRWHLSNINVIQII